MGNTNTVTLVSCRISRCWRWFWPQDYRQLQTQHAQQRIELVETHAFHRIIVLKIQEPGAAQASANCEVFLAQPHRLATGTHKPAHLLNLGDLEHYVLRRNCHH